MDVYKILFSVDKQILKAKNIMAEYIIRGIKKMDCTSYVFDELSSKQISFNAKDEDLNLYFGAYCSLFITNLTEQGKLVQRLKFAFTNVDGQKNVKDFSDYTIYDCKTIFEVFSKDYSEYMSNRKKHNCRSIINAFKGIINTLIPESKGELKTNIAISNGTRSLSLIGVIKDCNDFKLVFNFPIYGQDSIQPLRYFVEEENITMIDAITKEIEKGDNIYKKINFVK